MPLLRSVVGLSDHGLALSAVIGVTLQLVMLDLTTALVFLVTSELVMQSVLVVTSAPLSSASWFKIWPLLWVREGESVGGQRVQVLARGELVARSMWACGLLVLGLWLVELGQACCAVIVGARLGEGCWMLDVGW